MASGSDFSFAGVAFDLTAYRDGRPLEGFTFSEPVIITIQYGAELPNEELLTLNYWDEDSQQWLDAACGDYTRDLVHHSITVPICHLSQFALLSPPNNQVFLPLLMKGS